MYLLYSILSIVCILFIVNQKKIEINNSKAVLKFTLSTWFFAFFVRGIVRYPLSYKIYQGQQPGSGSMSLWFDIPIDLITTICNHFVYFIIALIIYRVSKTINQFKFFLSMAILFWFSYKYGHYILNYISNDSFVEFLSNRRIATTTLQYFILTLAICIFKISGKNKRGIPNNDILDEPI